MIEKFINSYIKCKCCKLSLHLYHYPLDKKTKIRTLDKCLSCHADCPVYGRQCRLGELK